MDGMREAHDEYPKPETKKNTLLAIRIFDLPAADSWSMRLI